METWVCLRAKRSENGGKESVITQPMRKTEKSVENGILTVTLPKVKKEEKKAASKRVSKELALGWSSGSGLSKAAKAIEIS